MKDPCLLVAVYRANQVEKQLKKVSRKLDILDKKTIKVMKQYGKKGLNTRV